MLMLPWPPKVLSPNSRAHWAARSRAARQYKQVCYMLTKAARMSMPGQRAVLSLTFCPPDRRKRDDDNLVAAFKSGRDGVAQALGVDDSVFAVLVQMSEPVKGGAVVVRLLRRAA